VTWVHHLVWLLPAFLLVVSRGWADRRLLWFAGVSWALMTSRVVWIWERNPSGPVGFVGGNLYVWISVALLFLVPLRQPEDAAGPGGPTASPTASAAGPAVGVTPVR
jgi:alpha-1,2-mannosyltransferase